MALSLLKNHFSTAFRCGVFCSRAAARKLLLFFQCGQSIADRISPSPYLPSRLPAPRFPTTTAAGDVHLALTVVSTATVPASRLWWCQVDYSARVCWFRGGFGEFRRRFLLPLSYSALAVAAAFAHTARRMRLLFLSTPIYRLRTHCSFSFARKHCTLLARRSSSTFYTHASPAAETTHRLPFLSISFSFLHHY